ncbi:hypothetical protein GGI17_003417 [Coemansia sp. S146]|nr:hypothetical protein GGI17_003417 [Coemansia sp. S146]
MSISTTTMTPEQRVSMALKLLESAGKKEYTIGKMSPLDHAFRVAQLAKNDGADEETILAVVGSAAVLRQPGFPNKTCELVEPQVSVKTYLVEADIALIEDGKAAVSLDFLGGSFSHDLFIEQSKLELWNYIFDTIKMMEPNYSNYFF